MALVENLFSLPLIIINLYAPHVYLALKMYRPIHYISSLPLSSFLALVLWWFSLRTKYPNWNSLIMIIFAYAFLVLFLYALRCSKSWLIIFSSKLSNCLNISYLYSSQSMMPSKETIKYWISTFKGSTSYCKSDTSFVCPKCIYQLYTYQYL